MVNTTRGYALPSVKLEKLPNLLACSQEFSELEQANRAMPEYNDHPRPRKERPPM